MLITRGYIPLEFGEGDVCAGPVLVHPNRALADALIEQRSAHAQYLCGLDDADAKNR